MIMGTGIDIIEVDRIEEIILKDNGFSEKIFSADEIRYCRSCAHPMEHFAARFAAKEAFLKATGLGLQLGFELNQIEVKPNDLGKPAISLHGSLQAEAVRYGWNKIHLSISHIKAVACAVVIIES